VLCVSEPEVAVTVTVDVPVATGFGLVETFLAAPHPLRKTRKSRIDRDPPPRERNLRLFRRFLSTGHMAARLKGKIAPKAASSLAGE
jgi:hypothetical protein